METSDKGYEMDGVSIWYHPFRIDRLPAIEKAQSRKLRERVTSAYSGDGDAEEAVQAAYRADRAKAGRYDPLGISHVKLIRGHHMKSGGIVLDMAALAPYLEATWADGIVLDNVEMNTGFYVHLGDTLEYDRDNPASLIEGFYVSRVEGAGKGWLFTFVTNYPDWADVENHENHYTRARFASAFSIELPPGFDVASGDYSKLEISGDRELAGSSSLWHLGRLATNAILYLNRARPDLSGSLSMYSSALVDQNVTSIYNCALYEVHLDIDWNDVTLRPGRWKVIEAGGDGKKLLVEWVQPTVVWEPFKHPAPGEVANVLHFRNRQRVREEDGKA